MRCFVMAVLVVVGLAACAPSYVAAGLIPVSYSQNFTSSTGVQANTDGTALTGYPAWTLYKTSASTSADATVDTAGTLTLNSVSGTTPMVVTAVASCQAISGQPSFDVSTTPLVVSGNIGGNMNAGWANVGLVVGNASFVFHPGLSGGASRMEIFHSGYNQPTDASSDNIDMGFTPALGQEYPASIQVTDAGTNYHLVCSVGSSFSNSFDVAKTVVGDLAYVGFRVDGNYNGTVPQGLLSNFSVSGAVATPEPTTLILLATGLIGLLAYAWRKRR